MKKKKSRVKPVTLAAWNVRTMQDREGTARPERRRALIDRELSRYNVDIALCAQGGNKPVLEICENPYFHVYLSIKTYIETECKRPHGIISSSLGCMAQ